MNKKKARRILIALVASLFLLACNCNTIQSIIATPTPTLTATPLPTATPIPTNTLPPPPPPPAASDFSGAVLTQADLPPGFQTIPAESMGLNSADYLSVFTFLKADNFETIFGYNMLLASNTDRAGFNLAIDNPDLIMEALFQGMELTPTDSGTFDVTGVGESACGAWATANMQGIMMRIEIVMFLRGNTGDTLVMMYQDDQTPSVSIVDLAQIWDGRLAQVNP